MLATPIPDEAALPAEVAQRLRSLPRINIYWLLGNVPSAVIPWTDMTRAVYQCRKGRQTYPLFRAHTVRQRQQVGLTNRE
jgi:hypothetical protein